DILISTDGGETFETYYTIDHTNHTTLNSFDRFTVPVVGYGGEIVKFKFLATWSSGKYYLSFDNIGVQEAAPEPSFRINPFEKEYGLYHIPLTSEDQLYTISNVGVGPLTVSSVALAGQDPEEFVLTDDNSYPVTLAFGESISFNVKYLPLTDGVKSADLFVNYNDGSAKTYSVPLTGSAYTSLISTFPFYESFEDGNNSNSTNINNWTQAYEPSSPYQRFWSASYNSSLYYTGPRTGDFSIKLQRQAATWLFRPIVLEAGKSYYFELYARQDTYTGATIKVAYGKSATPSAMTNTIINTSTVTSVLYRQYSGAFTAEESGLHFIGILGTTTVAPQFLTIDDISINKLSDDPEFVISETEIAFDPTGVGETSILRTFTVGNDSGGEIVIDSAQLSGENADQFDFADNNTYPIKLKAFQKATFRLYYKPTNTGNHTAKLTINYNDGEDQSVDVDL
ncbi:MAG TPA: choice-of-anchor D domain-containing protein, partial [Candidatus Cloacimonadota bacterium]|nr:choice-of-anchor D domain-containing protein [Candidatus Cloacimonadota bacterium]